MFGLSLLFLKLTIPKVSRHKLEPGLTEWRKGANLRRVAHSEVVGQQAAIGVSVRG